MAGWSLDYHSAALQLLLARCKVRSLYQLSSHPFCLLLAHPALILITHLVLAHGRCNPPPLLSLTRLAAPSIQDVKRTFWVGSANTAPESLSNSQVFT